jgi:hypothetical protein
MEGTRGTLIGMSLALVLGVGAGAAYLTVEALSPGPILTLLKHVAAAEGCRTAHALGLTPAQRGEPGYWPHHDGDDDGIACERWRGDGYADAYSGPSGRGRRR